MNCSLESLVRILSFYPQLLVISVLLERVFLRLGSAESDDQLELQLGKFLTPVLLKLSSSTDGVRKRYCFKTVILERNIDFQPSNLSI